MNFERSELIDLFGAYSSQIQQRGISNFETIFSTGVTLPDVLSTMKVMGGTYELIYSWGVVGKGLAGQGIGSVGILISFKASTTTVPPAAAAGAEATGASGNESAQTTTPSPDQLLANVRS